MKDSMNLMYKVITLVVLLFGVSACTSLLKKQGNEQKTAEPANFSHKIKPDNASSPAVLALIKKARVNAMNGDLDKAMLRLERAVRIEPSNSTVWHYMAKLFLQQENFKQASGYAAKSTSLAGNNKQLVIDNWRIIAHARYRMGDVRGARKAQDKINHLQQMSDK